VTGIAVTALVTLSAVALGGWLSLHGQDRLWKRDHARQWRDIRLTAYVEFVEAHRKYVAFAVEPDAQIKSIPHPRRPGEHMPFFDEKGRPYKERLEATRTAARLVAECEETAIAIARLVHLARQIAAARANIAADAIPPEMFDNLWSAERAFLVAARQELGLPTLKLGINADIAQGLQPEQ